MTQVAETGHFYVAELPSGQFIAASNTAPYFCFRAASEADVFAKVEAALTYYWSAPVQTSSGQQRPAATIHNWANRKAVPFPNKIAATA
ncbi:MAG: hypothetical protein AAF291_11725 [Pseudomonadota bacterium]